jgi:hypothetical protein
MGKNTLLFLMMLLASPCLTPAQDINSLRPLDNNRALRTDTTDRKAHRVIKNMQLSAKNPAFNLSLGGEIREQVRYYNPVNYGDVDSGLPNTDLFLMQRYMLHANLELGSHIRFFSQLVSGMVNGKNTVLQVDKDLLGVLQAFADLKFAAPFPMQLRLGRQEFSFGTERMLGLRDGRVLRQSFDGLRYTLTLNKITGDLFMVYPVRYDFGTFDNTTNTDNLIYSAYFTRPLRQNNRIDLYYFGNNRKDSIITDATVDECRHSFGLRISRSAGSILYDMEAVWQTGSYDKLAIRGWQLTGTAGYRWQNARLKPRFGIRVFAASGDRDSTDGQLNTFRPVYGRSPVHDLIPMGAANVALLSLDGDIWITAKTQFVLRCYAMRRVSAHDGLYASEMAFRTREPDQAGVENGMPVARGTIAEIIHTAGKHIEIILYGGYFQPGEYMKNTGQGMNMGILAAKATYRF